MNAISPITNGCAMGLMDQVRSVTVYRPNQLPQVFEGEDDLPGPPEMPDFRCRVADLFYMPGEEVPTVPPSPG
jgi:Uma2 family endonuclease